MSENKYWDLYALRVALPTEEHWEAILSEAREALDEDEMPGEHPRSDPPDRVGPN